MVQKVSVLIFCVIHAQLLLCIVCATNLGGAQISLSAVKSTSEHENASLLNALLRCQPNNLCELYNTYYTRSPWHCPGVSYCASYVGLDVRSECTAPCTAVCPFNTSSNDPPAIIAVTSRASVLQRWRWPVFEGQDGQAV